MLVSDMRRKGKQLPAYLKRINLVGEPLETNLVKALYEKHHENPLKSKAVIASLMFKIQVSC